VHVSAASWKCTGVLLLLLLRVVVLAVMSGDVLSCRLKNEISASDDCTSLQSTTMTASSSSSAAAAATCTISREPELHRRTSVWKRTLANTVRHGVAVCVSSIVLTTVLVQCLGLL